MSPPTSTLPRSTPALGLYAKVPLSLRDHGLNSGLNVHTPEHQDASCHHGLSHTHPTPMVLLTLPNYLNSALPFPWVQNVWHTTPPGFCPCYLISQECTPLLPPPSVAISPHRCLRVSLTRTVRSDLLWVSRTPLIFLVHLAFRHGTLEVCLNCNVLYYNLTYCVFMFCTSD